jgi:hypothetical protein
MHLPWKFNRSSPKEYEIYLHQDLWDQLKDTITADSQAQHQK